MSNFHKPPINNKRFNNQDRPRNREGGFNSGNRQSSTNNVVIPTKSHSNNGFGLSSAPSNKPLPALLDGNIRIIPLSGQGELGRNSWYFEQDNQIILIDAGVGFVPHGFKGGADLLLPNIEYLSEKKDKIQALIISNPHEEYAGAFLYLIDNLEIKTVYIPDILFQIHAEKLKEKNINVNIIETEKEYNISESFSFSAYKTSFAGIGTHAFLLKILNYKVFYAGSFKIDHNPPIRQSRLELNRIAREITKTGVDILISGSGNVETLGYTNSESSIRGKFDDILDKAKGRIITLISCSNLHRLQLLLQVAESKNYKVCLLGEEILNWFVAGDKLNYLKYNKNILVKLDQIQDNKVIYIIGSEEGNTLKPFIDLAYRRYEEISLTEGDTIIISANPPLGSSRMLANAVDQLFIQGVSVIGGRDAGVHVNSLAAQEELKFMYNLARPKCFIPAHGEARQLVLHAELLSKCGINPQNILILDNGNAIDIDPKKEQNTLIGKISSTPSFFSKDFDGKIDKQSLDERKTLGEDGALTVMVALNFENTSIIAGPQLKTMGSSFNTNRNWQEIENNLIAEIRFSVEKVLKQGQKDKIIIKHLIHDILNRRIREKFGMSKPLISVIIQEVK